MDKVQEALEKIQAGEIEVTEAAGLSAEEIDAIVQ